GNKIQYVYYPGIPITSIDSGEACSVSACCAVLAHFRCLVHHDDLDKICKSFEFLQPVGLHATENFFWSLLNSDPYSADSYDLLYSDESGKWGKHLCLLILEVLKANEYKGWLTAAE
ncbi:hypothetical protein B0H17DRAFT_941872, partial [Mycena rosella]